MNVLTTFCNQGFPLERAARISDGLSQAEIDHVCRDAIKLTILDNKDFVDYNLFESLLKERRTACQNKK